MKRSEMAVTGASPVKKGRRSMEAPSAISPDAI